MYQSIKKREKKTTFKILTLKISVITKLLSDKCRFPVNVTLVKENDVISDNSKIADVINDFFINAVKDLNIAISGDILCEANNMKDLF